MLSLNLTQQTSSQTAAMPLMDRAEALIALLDYAVAAHRLTSEEAQAMYRQWVDAQA
jgi:hypothetical protein